ncbi:E3 ubiquitin-protein ligase Hakai isoform X5 [Ambystoma mexicanum]|uniref:E3 ubiquitin-protein ligase Hakai isoform X5 n=1 Tax=Ambystoma mexicanum TaxID=8296 RepID=UPI0037E933AF
MDHNDNDLQGTNSTGSLGGLDVRRRIPIKLISKQTTNPNANTNKNKIQIRSPRSMPRVPIKAQSGDEEGFDYEEERYDCKSGDMFVNQRRFPGHLFWDYKINLIGEKDDTPVHFCDQCGLPIKVYGRMFSWAQTLLLNQVLGSLKVHHGRFSLQGEAFSFQSLQYHASMSSAMTVQSRMRKREIRFAPESLKGLGGKGQRNTRAATILFSELSSVQEVLCSCVALFKVAKERTYHKEICRPISTTVT